ncbi:hypothetical protein BJ875DRAFT_545298 [Amylocarpus encephaloides]|uniref:Uncharacterized protein n=1 Tax=Amylocarpus encephaloides TaxID=45428 RepID=A0A9P7YE52_9HELO|nr:hypothetical protein BJ875DRAFT_545298 [Amylocarpus encephaloides]
MSKEEIISTHELEGMSPITIHRSPSSPSPPPFTDRPKKTVSWDASQPPPKKHISLPIHQSTPNKSPSPKPKPLSPTSPSEGSPKKEHFPLIKSIARGEKPIIHKIQAKVAKCRVHKTTEARERMAIEEDEDEDWSLRNVDLGELVGEDEGMMPHDELRATGEDGEVEGYMEGVGKGGRPRIDFSHSTCAVEKYLELADLGTVSFATPKNGSGELDATAGVDKGKSWASGMEGGRKSIGTSALGGNGKGKAAVYRLFPDVGQESGKNHPHSASGGKIKGRNAAVLVDSSAKTQLGKGRSGGASAGKGGTTNKRDLATSGEPQPRHRSTTTTSNSPQANLSDPLSSCTITTAAFPNKISTTLPQFGANTSEANPSGIMVSSPSPSQPNSPTKNYEEQQGFLATIPPPSTISTQTQSSRQHTYTTLSSASSTSSTQDSPIISDKKDLTGIPSSEIYNGRYVGREQYHLASAFDARVRPPAMRDTSWARNKPDWSGIGRDEKIARPEKVNVGDRLMLRDETGHIFDFLQAADAFISWDAEANGLSWLDPSAESALLFNDRFARLTPRYPSPIQAHSGEAAHAIPSPAFRQPVFNYDASTAPAPEFIGLHFAAKTLVVQFVESKGGVFSPSNARELSALVLSCLDSACEPELKAQMPREGLEIVIPRILIGLEKEFAVGKEEVREVEDEDEDGFYKEVVVPVRLWYRGFKERVREVRREFVEVWPVEVWFMAVVLVGVGVWHVLKEVGRGWELGV